MKKILVGLVACAMIFTMSASSAFAGNKLSIPFWQNGGNVSTLISIQASDGSGPMGTYTSTGATITISLIAADTSSGYTVSPTTGTANRLSGTSGLGFATATFQSARGAVMQVDTSQIGTNWATLVWNTDVGGAYSATAAKFGYGTVDTGTSGVNEHSGWVAIYGGTNPAGFTVQLLDNTTTPAAF